MSMSYFSSLGSLKHTDAHPHGHIGYPGALPFELGGSGTDIEVRGGISGRTGKAEVDRGAERLYERCEPVKETGGRGGITISPAL